MKYLTNFFISFIAHTFYYPNIIPANLQVFFKNVENPAGIKPPRNDKHAELPGFEAHFPDVGEVQVFVHTSNI